MTGEGGPWLGGGGLVLLLGGLLTWTGALSRLGNLPGDVKISSGSTRISIPARRPACPAAGQACQGRYLWLRPGGVAGRACRGSPEIGCSTRPAATRPYRSSSRRIGRIRHLSPRSPAGVDLSGRSSDLYLLHGRGRVTLAGTVAGFADLQAAGLIRY